MTTISGNSAIDALAASNTAGKSGKTLGQEDFLKLLTTQLKTQDPFDPVDNTQMVAQMAQFSAVAGQSEMNQTLKQMTQDLASSRIGDASSWIGRSALVASDMATPLSDGTYAGEVTLPGDADAVTLSLVDAKGEIVHSEMLGAQAAGTIAFGWDGRKGDGSQATGPLKLIVNARSAEGAVKATTATWTTVGGIQSPASGATRLVTPLGLLSPQEALRLS
jgi:flagellar basal-body rod modification protein FlgD